MTRERRLFVLLVVLETAVFAWLVLSGRLPRGHDTLGLYLQQYLFLADATQSHAVALWMPNTAHGLVTNWTANCQGGLLQNAILLLGGVPAGTNHLPVFYAGLFVDEMILLVGVWTLSRRYYATLSARFFVSAAAIGSAFWMDHLVCNFRVYFCLPLILALTHDFLESGSRGKFFLAFLLMVLQFTGNTPYIPLFTLLVVLVYFIVHVLVVRMPAATLRRSLRPRPVDVLIVAANLGLLALLYVTLTHGASEIRLFRPGRNPDGSVGLDEFLTHGGALSPLRYLDLVLGLSPSLDYTLYCGILTLACAALGVFHRPGRTVYGLLICLILVVLFSTGFLSAVATMAYSVAPPLHFFRYVALTAPVAKLFLILLSGFGVEALLARREELKRTLKPLSRGLLIAAIPIALLVVATLRNRETLSSVTEILRTGRLGLGQRPGADAPAPAGALLGGSALALAAAGILFGLRARRTEISPALLAAFLGIHTLDLYRWKVQMLTQESIPLDAEQLALQEIRPVPYIPRRDPDYEHSPRFRAWKNFPDQGALYDFTDPFLGVEPPSSRYLTMAWLAPYDALRGVREERPSSPSWARISGSSVDKLQVFRAARSAASEQRVAEFLKTPEFRGDVLLLGPRQESGSLAPLAADTRLAAPCSIERFDFDSLTVKVEVPADEEDAWLMYADAWHPGWTATLNARPVPVERAFLAYKAVKLTRGSNVVEFRFSDSLRSVSYRVIGLASLGMIVAVAVLAFRLDKGKPEG
jgi:hypothetical protein